jgi:hypothetical protein
MNINLVKEEDLVGLTAAWPVKDASSIWKELQTMRSKDFNILVLGYLTNTAIKHRRGRPTGIEKVAKAILFEMSPKQRATAYAIIEKRVDFLISKGWWQEDLTQLCNVSVCTAGKATQRSTGFNRQVIDKRKLTFHDCIVRVKFIELTSTISDYKEWLISYVETDHEEKNKVIETKFTDYNKALEFFAQF